MLGTESVNVVKKTSVWGQFRKELYCYENDTLFRSPSEAEAFPLLSLKFSYLIEAKINKRWGQDPIADPQSEKWGQLTLLTLQNCRLWLTVKHLDYFKVHF
jgi:hypothetical protein